MAYVFLNFSESCVSSVSLSEKINIKNYLLNETDGIMIYFLIKIEPSQQFCVYKMIAKINLTYIFKFILKTNK